MAWDNTKPAPHSLLVSKDIRDNWDALAALLSVDHDFSSGTHKALVLPANGLTVGTTLKLSNDKLLVGFAVDQDGTSVLQVQGTGLFTDGVKFGDGTTQNTASYSKTVSDSTYAPLLSPSLSGIPTAPTAVQNNSSTQLATTAFVVGQAGTATPLMAGTASVGTSLLYARENHQHPTDTSNFSLELPLMDGEASVGDYTTYARSNHKHPTDNTRAPLASPIFTGIPAGPTADISTNTTQLATTAFVKSVVADLVATAPDTLDTLNELATALGNDPNFATTMTTALAGKVDKTGSLLTGALGVSGGTAAAPGIYVSGALDTGITATSSAVGLTINGTIRLQATESGATVTGTIAPTAGVMYPDGKTQSVSFLGLQTAGIGVTQRSKINFVGPFVTLTDDAVGDVSTVTIGSNQGTVTVQTFSGDNATKTFTLSSAPAGQTNTCVHIGGTYIPKSAYSLVGTAITFVVAPTTGVDNIEVAWVNPLPLGLPAAGSIYSELLADNIVLRGTPTASTPDAADNSTRLATTAFVTSKVGELGTLAAQDADDVIVTKIGVGAGGASTPSLYINNNTNTGFWSPTTNTLALSVGGVEAWRTTATGRLLLQRSSLVASNEVLSVNGLGAFGANSITVVGDNGTDSIVGSYSNTALKFVTNNTEVGSFSSAGNFEVKTGTLTVNNSAVFNTTTAIKLPTGSTVQRPTGEVGLVRFNSETGELEVYDGAAWVGAGGGTTSVSTQTFTESGTWTKPASGSMARIQVWGGGGGGIGYYQSGAGGGGGGYCEAIVPLSTLAASETVVIGAGGVKGVNAATAGGSSSFGSVVTALGGGGATGGGFGGLPSTANEINDSGRDPATIGVGIWAGGEGAGYLGYACNSMFGGGGGGNTSAANSHGVSVFGGNGGINSTTPAQAPGGGGYGAPTNNAGGNGARGEVRITVW